jgi:hypothetical protein
VRDSLVCEVVDRVPRAAIEDLMVRGQHPTTHVAWYARIVVLAWRGGQLVGALLAQPGYYCGRRRRQVSVPGTIRVNSLLLAGTTRERWEIAAALIGTLRVWGYLRGIHTAYTFHDSTMRTETRAAMRRLVTRFGGTLDTTLPDGTEVWAWRTSSGT